MKRKSVLSKCSKSLMLLPFLAIGAAPVSAQVVMTNQNAYTQNFNSLPATNPAAGSNSWVNNATLTGWYAEASGGLSQITAGDGTNSTVGLRSFGETGGSDRSLGCVASTSTGAFSYGLRMRNNTGDLIRNFQVNFTLEQWAKLNGNKSASMLFAYQKGTAVASLTAGAWTTVPDLNITTGVTGGPSGAINGNSNQTIKSFIITEVNLLPGEEIMFRWYDAFDQYSGIYFAIDDITVTPSGKSEVFYSKASGSLASLSSWSSTANGAGYSPSSFLLGHQIFYLQTSTALDAAWEISGENSKLVVGNGTAAVSFVIPQATGYTGVVDVANNATLTINCITMPTLGVLGSQSTVNYSGTVSQTLPEAEYANLYVGNSSKKLSSATRIKNNLTLSNARLEIDNHDLFLEPTATITGANANSYIVTKGNGRLKRRVVAQNNAAPVEFPVGTDVYLPVTISQRSNGTTDIFSVKAIDGIYNSYNNNQPSGTAYTHSVINKTWIIDEDVVGGSNVTLTVQWNETDALIDFDPALARINHFKNGAWDDAAPVSVTYSNGVASLSRSGITSFSPYAVFSKSPGSLPVELISFEARLQKGAVVCKWQTAQEINNDYFTVERSLDGKSFAEVGTVKGYGTRSQISSYQFTDTRPLAGTTYYRLRQTDFDGTMAYSKIVAVNAGSVKNTVAFDVYPNPAAGVRFLKTNAELKEPVAVTVTNVQGQVISRQQVAPETLQAGLSIDLGGQPKGVYFITVQSGREITTLRALQH